MLNIQRTVANIEPPMLVTDKEGKVIYMNLQAQISLSNISLSDSITKIIEKKYIEELFLYKRKIDCVMLDNSEFTMAIIKQQGNGINQTAEFYFYKNKNSDIKELYNDKRLLTSYSKIADSELCGTIKLNEMLEQMVSEIKMDLRYAYRKIDLCELPFNPELYVNLSYVYTAIVGTIVALNEIEYRNSIKIKADNVMNEYALEISVDVLSFNSAHSFYEISELYPKIAIRLFYIVSMCKDNGIECRFKMTPNKIIAEFFITNLINKSGRVGQSLYGAKERAFVSHVMSLFSYDVPNAEVEEEIE